MADLKKVNGRFVGKQIITEAQNYKKYKYTFDVNGKNWNFIVFTPWTKKDGTEKKGVSPDKLEENEDYMISYTEYQSP